MHKNATDGRLRKPVIVVCSLLAGIVVESLLEWAKVPKLLGLSSGGFACLVVYLLLALRIFERFHRLSSSELGRREPLGLEKNRIDHE